MMARKQSVSGAAAPKPRRCAEDGALGLARLNVLLDAESVERARKGNGSLGIRKAVAETPRGI